MKKKLVVLGTAIMAAVAITACGGTQTQTTEAETTTQAPATTQDQATTQESSESLDQSTQAGDTGMGDTSTGDTSSQSGSDSASEEGADMDMSEIKPFAQKVQKAVADKDMKELADLCAYPLYVSMKSGEGEEIADKDALLKLDASKIFTDSMLKEIAATDVDTLEQFGAGVIMGNENTIIFNHVDGHAAITGINVQ